MLKKKEGILLELMQCGDRYWNQWFSLTFVIFFFSQSDSCIRNATSPTNVTYTCTNVWLCFQDGERYARRGYWGDIVVSPFVPLGIESEEKSFFKKSNNVYTKVKSMLPVTPVHFMYIVFLQF